MSKFTDRLRIVRYFSDKIMAARMPADEDLIFDMRKDRKDAAAIIDEMESVIRAAKSELEEYEVDATGETYNNVRLNAVLERLEKTE